MMKECHVFKKRELIKILKLDKKKNWNFHWDMWDDKLEVEEHIK